MTPQELHRVEENLLAPFNEPDARAPAYYRPYEKASVSTLGAFIGGVKQAYFDSFTGVAIDAIQRFKQSNVHLASSAPLSVEQIKEQYGIDVPSPVSKEYMDMLTNKKAEQNSIKKALSVYKEQTGGSKAPVFGYFAGLALDPLFVGAAGVSIGILNNGGKAVNAINKFAKLNMKKEQFIAATIPAFEALTSGAYGYLTERRETFLSDEKKRVDPETVGGYAVFGGVIGTMVVGLMGAGATAKATSIANKVEYAGTKVKDIKLLPTVKAPKALPPTKKYVNNVMDSVVHSLNQVATQPDNLAYQNQLFKTLNQYQAFKKVMDFNFYKVNKKGMEKYLKEWVSRTKPGDYFSFVKFPKNLNNKNIGNFVSENYNYLKNEFDVLTKYMELPEMSKAVEDIRFYFPKIEKFETMANTIKYLPEYGVERIKEVYDLSKSYYNHGVIKGKGKSLTFFDSQINGKLPDVLEHIPKLEFNEVIKKFSMEKFFLDSHSGKYKTVKNLRNLNADVLFEDFPDIVKNRESIFQYLGRENLDTNEFLDLVDIFERTFSKKYFLSPEGLLDFADDIQFYRAMYSDKVSRSLISSNKIRDIFYMNRDILYEADMFNNTFYKYLEDTLPKFEKWMSKGARRHSKRFKKYNTQEGFDYKAIDEMTDAEFLEVFGTDIENLNRSFTNHPINLPSLSKTLANDFKDNLLPIKDLKFKGLDEVESLEEIAKLLGIKKPEAS